MSPKKKSRVRSKKLTIAEMARMGGEATAKNRTPEQRSEAARKAAKDRWAREKAKK